MTSLVPEYLSQTELGKARLSKWAVSKTLREAADLDGNRLIDFHEWVFFDTLLHLPLESIEVSFRAMDADASGSLDADEFLQVLQTVTGNKLLTERPRIKSLFGSDGRRKVTLAAFKAWYTQLKREVVLLEFQLMDADGNGRVSAAEFGSSVVAYNSGRYGAALAELRDEDGELTFEDYWAFQRVAEQMERVEEAIRLFLSTASDGSVSRTHFKRAVLAVTNVPLSEAVVETLFVLFNNSSGRLSTARLAAELRNRAAGGALASSPSVFQCVANCFESEIVRRESVKIKD